MKSWPALLGLVVVTYSFAHTEATSALLSILNGRYYGHDCEVKVLPTQKGVSVEIEKNGQYMEYFVHEGSGFQYRPYGRFVSSYRINKGSVDYNEYTFMTTPTNNGQYVTVATSYVRNRTTKTEQIECEIIDEAFKGNK